MTTSITPSMTRWKIASCWARRGRSQINSMVSTTGSRVNQHLVASIHWPGMQPATALEQLHLLAEEVRPQLSPNT